MLKNRKRSSEREVKIESEEMLRQALGLQRRSKLAADDAATKNRPYESARFREAEVAFATAANKLAAAGTFV